MTIKEYEDFVDANFKFKGEQLQDNEKLQRLAYCDLGLSGEAGECTDAIKKLVRGDIWGYYNPRTIEDNIIKELGDVMYYAVKIAHIMGHSIEDIMTINHQKLELRNKEGKVPQ